MCSMNNGRKTNKTKRYFDTARLVTLGHLLAAEVFACTASCNKASLRPCEFRATNEYSPACRIRVSSILKRAHIHPGFVESYRYFFCF